MALSTRDILITICAIVVLGLLIVLGWRLTAYLINLRNKRRAALQAPP